MHKCRLSVLGICVAATFISTLGCTESEDPGSGLGTAGVGVAGNPGGAAGSNGNPGIAGTNGAAGSNGNPGGTAGSSGTTGSSGTAGAGTAGSSGTAGTGGTAGMTGTAGRAGTAGGGGGSGAAGASPDGGATDGPPTFTMLYNQILSSTPTVPASSCGGAICHHSPGGGKGLEHIDMRTKAAAYTGVKKFVVVGNANGSKLFTEVNTGAMPEGKPKLPANFIKMVSDWIKAGALDN